MKLTKECETAFIRWYLNDHSPRKYRTQSIDQTYIRLFSVKPLAEQWGVLQLFFDSVGMDIEIRKCNSIFSITIWYNYEEFFLTNYKTREEAWEAAIEAANKQFNENYGK